MKRGADCRKKGERTVFGGRFPAVAVMLAGTGAGLMVLAGVFPHPFLPFLVIYGISLLLAGLVWLRRLVWPYFDFVNLDWRIGKWPVLMILVGLPCVIVFFVLFEHFRSTGQP